MKVLIAGDIHGDWGKLNALMQKKQPDFVLQCGDFGWWPQWEVKRNTVYHLREKAWTHKGAKPPEKTSVYFCDGNHENHWDLAKENMCMRDVPCELYDRVFHAPRGYVHVLPDGRNVLFIGGADSVDKNLRSIGIDWYPEELISQEDLDYIMGLNCRVDIVISHTCPKEWQPRESMMKVNDPSREALSRVLEKFKPSLWYFGHWHCEAEGKYQDTYWHALDYPGHGTRWWAWLK